MCPVGLPVSDQGLAISEKRVINFSNHLAHCLLPFFLSWFGGMFPQLQWDVALSELSNEY